VTVRGPAAAPAVTVKGICSEVLVSVAGTIVPGVTPVPETVTTLLALKCVNAPVRVSVCTMPCPSVAGLIDIRAGVPALIVNPPVSGAIAPSVVSETETFCAPVAAVALTVKLVDVADVLLLAVNVPVTPGIDTVRPPDKKLV